MKAYFNAAYNLNPKDIELIVKNSNF